MQISLFKKNILLVQKSKVRSLLYKDTLCLCGFDVLHISDLCAINEHLLNSDIVMIDDDVAEENELFQQVKHIFLSHTPVPIILVSNKRVPVYMREMFYTVFAKSDSVSNLAACIVRYSENVLYGP